MQTHTNAGRPFELGDDVLRAVPAVLRRWTAGTLERAAGLSALNDLYRRCAEPVAAPRDFCERALEALGITIAVDGPGPSALPASGPLIVAANHPHGALDGLVLDALVRRVRPDVRVLGNEWLARIPELRERTVRIDVFAGASRAGRHTSAFKDACAWLEGGGAIIVFPAGEVAHAVSRDGRLVEGPWRAGVARLATRTGAAVVPVGIRGGNSRLFRAVGRMHPLLRTALLPRELLDQRGRTVCVGIGPQVAAVALARWRDDRERAAYLRLRSVALAHPSCLPAGHGPGAPSTPVAPPVPAGELAADVAALGPDHLLLASGPCDVFCAPARALPNVLREIGRLREATFRAAGEGTGRALDLDRFDRHYLHLFVWHRERREIVGAYRLMATDRLGAGGARRLYTRTLFGYGRRFLTRLGPALELGRSFVRVEYQRDYAPLLLLWKGIGRLVARAPRYRRLFGPVSISAAYHPVSRDLLVAAVHDAGRHPLAPLVRARRPVDAEGGCAGHRHGPRLALQDLPTVLGEIEADGKSVPVLLRHYLRLGARPLAFSVDPAFSDVVDGFMVVELGQVPPSLLTRYLGADGAAAVLAADASPAGAVRPAPLRPASP